MTIQSSRMYMHSSWKIILLHVQQQPLCFYKTDMDNLGEDSIEFPQSSWQCGSHWGSSSSTLHCLCASLVIQTITIFFTDVLYPWLILRVMHAWIEIILWTPANWSRTINRSSKMIPLPSPVGLAPQRWVQRTKIGGQMSAAAAQHTVGWNNKKDKADGNKKNK